MRTVFITAACLALVGCGSTRLTTTGPAHPAREPGCEFQIFTAAHEGYIEIGSIDVTPGGYGANTFLKLDKFKEKIRPYVCEAGGDAAIALANGHGMYIKATVLLSAPVQSAPSPASTPAPAAAGGCQYDAQCKGDRICREGACVDP